MLRITRLAPTGNRPGVLTAYHQILLSTSSGWSSHSFVHRFDYRCFQPPSASRLFAMAHTHQRAHPVCAVTQAIASPNLSAAFGLRLPSLAPLTLLANLNLAGGLGRASACSSACPVGSRL